MNGFLARLTARAGGDQRPAVRPRHRSLFEPGPATRDEPAPLIRTSLTRAAPPEPSLQPPRAQAALPLPPRVATRAASNDEPTNDEPTNDEPTNDEPTNDEPTVVPAPAMADFPTVASAPIRVSSATAPSLPLGEHLAEPGRGHDDEPLPRTPVEQSPKPATTAPSDRAPVALDAQPEPVPPRQQEERKSPKTAGREPRLARAMRGHEPPATRRTTPRLDAHRDQEQPIVHVTIGRVEVRATPDQKQGDTGEARKRPVVTTLDAYLKQREEARR